MSAPQPVLTILAVADLERSVAFYRRAFGWPVAVEAPVYVQFDLPGGHGISLYEREAFGANPGQRPHLPGQGAISGAEVYMMCDDIERAQADLQAAGARLLSPLAPRPWGDEVAYYSDPDGNVLALAREVEA